MLGICILEVQQYLVVRRTARRHTTTRPGARTSHTLNKTRQTVVPVDRGPRFWFEAKNKMKNIKAGFFLPRGGAIGRGDKWGGGGCRIRKQGRRYLVQWVPKPLAEWYLPTERGKQGRRAQNLLLLIILTDSGNRRIVYLMTI